MKELEEGELDIRINLIHIVQYVRQAKFEIRKGNIKRTIYFLDKIEDAFDKAGLEIDMKKYEKES